jgi:hypothetical protein
MQAFLKWTLAGAMGVAAFNAVPHSAKTKLWSWLTMGGVKVIDSLELRNEHKCVFGRTRSGKTYGILHSLSKAKQGVLYINTNHEKKSIPGNFVFAESNIQIGQIEKALAEGKKINFVPNADIDKAAKEVSAIVKYFFDGKERDFFLAVDECHLYKSDALKSLLMVATGGLSRGIKGIWISQRGANVHNDLVTQSSSYVFYATNLEEQYWEKSYGIPLTEINRKIKAAGDYTCCEYDLETIHGAYKVK